MTQTTDECYSRDDLKNYLQGWSAQHDAAQIEHHLASCTLCEASVSTLEAELLPLLDAPSSSSNAFIESPSNQRVIDAAILAAQQINPSQLNTPAPQNAPDAPATLAALAAPVSHLGPYTILAHLGSGGMGSVYLARHQSLNKQVAIKLLPGHAFHNQHFVARFRREIRAIGQLNHPSIVSATDAGESDGLHYLVMEHIDGLDLSRLARAAGPLRIEDAAAIMTRVALGLSYAHANGIVHRDVKPSNIMVRSDGEVKILDFGLAHTTLWDEVTAQLTTVGQLMGTLDYMAPEQADNPDAIDYRADLYSLGATLYRMLTGRPPLISAPNLSPLAKLRLIATAEPPSLSILRPDAPASLVELVTSLLARDPNDRPASAAHVAELLQAHCPGANLPKLVATSQQTDSLHPDSSSYTVSPNIVPQPAASSGKSGSGWRSIGRWVAAMFIPLSALAAGMIVLETQKGKLVIQSKDANVTVRVLKDHKLYETLQVVPGGKTTKLYAGTYEIEIDGPSDRYALNKNQVLVQNGETVIATIDDIATNPAPSDQLANASSSLDTNEATYQGKPLTYWLHLYDVERDPIELVKVTEAIAALVSPDTRIEVANQLMISLRKRPDRSIELNWTDNDGRKNTSSLDGQTFQVIKTCFPNIDERIAFFVNQIDTADDPLAISILNQRNRFLDEKLDDQHLKPLLDLIVTKLNALMTSEKLVTTCGHSIAGFLFQQNLKPELTKSLIGTLESSNRLGNQFWLSRIDHIDSLKRCGPDYVSLLERKAVQAVLSSETPAEYFFTATAVIANIQKSGVLDRAVRPLPRRDELIALMKRKLNEQLASQDKLLEFRILDPQFEDDSNFFLPSMTNMQLNGETNWPGMGAISIDSRAPRVNAGIAIIDWFKYMNLKSDIEGEALALTKASSELELECYLMLEPSIVPKPQEAPWAGGTGGRGGRGGAQTTLRWPSLQFETERNFRNEAPSTSPSPAQWAAYFLYWKAWDSLPADQGLPIYQLRRQKLYQHYYPEYVNLRDRNKDGYLSVSEMFDQFNAQRIGASRQKLLDGKPIDIDAPLSQEDTIALMLQNPTWRNIVQDEARGGSVRMPESLPFASSPNARNSARVPNGSSSVPKTTDEPTYQGKTLSYWLHLFDVEREQEELFNVIRALNTLATPQTNAQIASHVIGSISKRPKQEFQESRGPGIPPYVSSLDRAAFGIIHSCSPTLAEYVALIDAALKEADDDWASRILEQQYVFLRSQSDEKALQPLLDFAVRKLKADNTSKGLDVQSANFLVSMVDANNFSHQTNLVALEAVRNCKRLGDSFWLSKVDNLETVKKQKPLYISIVEEKAIDAALSTQTSPEYFSAAVGIAANIIKSGVLNREEYPIPRRDALNESLKRKLQELLADQDKLFQFQLLESKVYDEALIFVPKLDHLQEPETGYRSWPGIDSSGVVRSNSFGVDRPNDYSPEPRRESRQPRTTPALIILTWFDIANLSDYIQPELQKLADACTENELECFLRLEPSVHSKLRSSLNFATLEMSDALPEALRNKLTKATETEWAAYFLYWKALDLLPEAQRDGLIKLRREKLYHRYYPRFLSLRDENSDGLLSPSEMLLPQFLQQYRESKQASSSNGVFDTDAPLTENAAVVIMLEHQDWLRSDPNSAAVQRSLPPGTTIKPRRGATDPSRLVTPTESTGNEPIYQGKPLSHWLHLFELEYDPGELSSVIVAIKALINPNTGSHIANQLITTLPKRTNLSIKKRAIDKIIDVSLDRETLAIIRKCLTDPNDSKPKGYIPLVIAALAKADDQWAVRMFDAGYLDTDDPLDQQQCKVLNDFFKTKLEDTSTSKLFATKCAHRLVLLANRKDVPAESAQQSLDILDTSKRLGTSYWIEYIAGNEAMQTFQPAYLALLERKAVDIALSPAATPEQLCAAIGIITNIRRSGKLDPQKYELPHLAQLKAESIARLRRLLTSPQELLSFYSLESVTNDYAGIFFPVPANAWPGVLVLTFDSDKQRVNTALATLGLFEALNLVSEIEPEIAQLASVTADQELECSWELNPSVVPNQNLHLDWSTLEVTQTTQVVVDRVAKLKTLPFANSITHSQWAAFFIYWKAVKMLPEPKRTAQTQSRMSKLAGRYYSTYLLLRDENEDGYLSLAEMLPPNQVTDQQLTELRTLEGKPIEQDQALSQDDAIAIMSQHTDWLTFVKKEPRVDSPKDSKGWSTVRSGPIYQGKPLSHWLHLFDVERDPKELGNVTEAIEALVADDTKSLIRDELLKRLPNRPNQPVVLQATPKDTYLDIKTLQIVERCSANQQEYIALIAKLYREADPKLSTRILLGSGLDQDSWRLQEKEAQPIIEFCRSVLEDPARSKSDVQYSQQIILNFANRREFSDELSHSLTDFMLTSNQFDQTFWFERSSIPRGLPNLDPRFLVAIERKAVDTVLAPETTAEYFSIALAFMIEIRTLEWVDLNRFEIPHREQLQQRLAQRLKELANSSQDRRQFRTLGSGTKIALGTNSPNRRSPFEPSPLRNTTNILKGNGGWPGGLSVQPSFDSDIRELQVLTILNYIESMKIVDKMESELEGLVESAADGELACFNTISPNISTLTPGKVFIWHDMKVKDTRAESPTFLSGSTPEQWADYFTYWKAIDLLPEAKRHDLLRKRNNKLYAKYWVEVLTTKDHDKDGRLTLVDLVGSTGIERMKSANELVARGQTIDPKTPLDESTAIELLKNQSRPYIFGVGD